MEEYKYKAFIVVEGVDGSGKSTQAQLLAKWLQDNGQKAVYIHFPDYDEPTGKVIKGMLDGKYGENADDVNMYAASMMYAVDRWCSIHDHYREYFFNDYIIISDRYVASNLIHQGAKLAQLNTDDKVMALSTTLNKYCEWLENIEYNMFEIPKPDMTIYLSVSPEKSIERLNSMDKELDIHEHADFIKRSYYVGKYFSHYLYWDIIDCGDKSFDEIQEKMKEIISTIV